MSPIRDDPPASSNILISSGIASANIFASLSSPSSKIVTISATVRRTLPSASTLPLAYAKSATAFLIATGSEEVSIVLSDVVRLIALPVTGLIFTPAASTSSFVAVPALNASARDTWASVIIPEPSIDIPRVSDCSPGVAPKSALCFSNAAEIFAAIEACIPAPRVPALVSNEVLAIVSCARIFSASSLAASVSRPLSIIRDLSVVVLVASFGVSARSGVSCTLPFTPKYSPIPAPCFAA